MEQSKNISLFDDLNNLTPEDEILINFFKCMLSESEFDAMISRVKRRNCKHNCNAEQDR